MPTMRKTQAFVCLVLLSFILAPAHALAATSEIPQELAARIQRVENGLIPNPGIVVKDQPSKKASLAERMKAYRVPGLSLAVIDGYAIEWEEGYGVQESGGTSPVTPETLFQAASISKPVAAATALYYVEKGILGLDEDVNSVRRTGKF